MSDSVLLPAYGEPPTRFVSTPKGVTGAWVDRRYYPPSEFTTAMKLIMVEHHLDFRYNSHPEARP